MGGNRLVPTGSLFFNISNFTVMGCSVCLFLFFFGPWLFNLISLGCTVHHDGNVRRRKASHLLAAGM